MWQEELGSSVWARKIVYFADLLSSKSRLDSSLVIHGKMKSFLIKQSSTVLWTLGGMSQNDTFILWASRCNTWSDSLGRNVLYNSMHSHTKWGSGVLPTWPFLLLNPSPKPVLIRHQKPSERETPLSLCLCSRRHPAEACIFLCGLMCIK